LVAVISFFIGRNLCNCLLDGTFDAIRIGERQQPKQHQQQQEQHQQEQQQQQQQHEQQRRLEFVHIPKTGGTAIESIASDANITWSICHFGIPKNILIISFNLTRCLPDGLKHDWPWKPKFNQCPWWHVPPAYIEAFFPEHNPYAGADLFTVVRNPYERTISEYYYAIQDVHQGKNKEDGMNDERKFNDVLNKQLSKFLSEMRRGDASRKLPGNKKYFMNSGHLIPQYDFVYDIDRRKKIVEHVLRFEHLREDFSTLMDRYDLPLELPTKVYRSSAKKELGVHNLTSENLLLIENIYWDDFREFGYEVLSLKMS
jgi:hypothetical protein